MRDELARLDAALRAMGGEPQVPERASRTSSPPRAPRGQNRAKILSIISDRPGVSAEEIAQSAGIDRAVVYSSLSKLAQAGEVEKVDVNGQNGYRVPASNAA